MTHDIHLKPIARVRAGRTTPRDDHWGDAPAVLELEPWIDAEAIEGLEAFSHLEVVFHFHLVPDEKIQTGARHPRNRADWPRVGIFAQHAKGRPNRLGLSRCRLVRVEGRKLHVLDLDAIDGTPVLDIKPWFDEFAPIGPTHQPAWSRELMADYYRPCSEAPDEER